MKWGPVAGSCFGALLSDPGYAGSPHEALSRGAWALLDGLQDRAVEELTVPWPPVAGSKLGELAQPHASVRNDILCLWYGDEEQPALPMISVGLSG